MACGPITLTSCGNRHEHKFSDAFKFDETNHWVECECGEKNEVTAHTWNEGVITKEATLSEDGELTKTCVCGATKVEAIDSLAKRAIEITAPDKEMLFDQEMPDEEFEFIVSEGQLKALTPFDAVLNTDYYFKFDYVKPEVDYELYYYIDIMLEKDGTVWNSLDGESELTFKLYSSNDLVNPLANSTSTSFVSGDDLTLASGTYYLQVNIKSSPNSVTVDGIDLIKGLWILCCYEF